MNDSALRPPTTMAPPVPLKKKISIPSVFLVDDEKKNKSLPAGNGSATYARTMDMPPPRPLRPPPVGGHPAPLNKCNTLNLSSSQISSSSPTPPPPQPIHSSSQLLLLSACPSTSLPRYTAVPAEAVIGQPHPPPRRHQVSSVGVGGGVGGSSTVTGAPLSSNKCLSGKVIHAAQSFQGVLYFAFVICLIS